MTRATNPLRSIGLRFSILVLLIAVICTSVFLIYARSLERKRINKLASSQAYIMANFVKEMLLSAMKSESPKAVFRRTLKESSVITRIKSADGRMIYSNIVGEKNSDSFGNCALSELVEHLGSYEGYTSDLKEFVKRTDLTSQGECVNCHKPEGKLLATLEVRLPTTPVRKMVRDIHLSLVIAGIICGLALLATVLLLFATTFRRLDVLKEKMRKVGKGDLSVTAPEKPEDQIGELGKTFNSLVEQLRNARVSAEKAHKEEVRHLEHLVAVSELATGIVHELKNPLAAVSATVQSLRKDMRHDDPNAAIFDNILSEVNAASRTLQHLLQFGKQPEPAFNLMDIARCMKEVLTLINEQTENGSITVDMDISPDLPMIQGDERLLQQVFLNIILNAIQAKNEGLHLVITLTLEKDTGGRLVRSSQGKDEYLKVSISDNGPGVEPQYLGKIFRPFFSTKTKGSGLGLAISRIIIEKHGGTIFAQGEPGKGVTFIIYLPVDFNADMKTGGDVK